MFLALLAGSTIAFANPSDEVVVIYNSREPESKGVADYYAKKRGIPQQQVLAFDLPVGDSMSRQDFHEHFQKPLSAELVRLGLFHFETLEFPATNGNPARKIQKLTQSRIRYLALCYGVPLVIFQDINFHEPGEEGIRTEFKRNEAAVDSELSCLPLMDAGFVYTGPFQNRFLGCTNATLMNPTNGILMVTRLDGPSASIARSLVDKSMEAETNGLWGRAYFDLRGITNAGYLLGEKFISGASEVCRAAGYDTIIDQEPGTFPPAFPLSHIALYAGWYDQDVSGAFARPKVEFMPGAFAYHLHSFSAATLRTSKHQWCGPLLYRGATATMGNVDEPYLQLTPNIAVFFECFVDGGYSFGEAAYASQMALSWQCTVVGDPLYRPFSKNLSQRHLELDKSKGKMLEWSYERLSNLLLLRGKTPAEVIAAIKATAISDESPILQEKLGDLYAATGDKKAVVEALSLCLKLHPSPQQEARVTLNLGHLLLDGNKRQECFDLYSKFVVDFPDYADRAYIFRTLVDLARRLGLAQDAAGYQRMLDELTPLTQQAPVIAPAKPK